MTNRKIAYIIKDRTPLISTGRVTVQQACRLMRERRAGSILVIDEQENLIGIFTGRDAVRFLAEGGNAATVPITQAMTADPAIISPDGTAIEALRAMCDGGFRHLPVVDNGRIWGVVSRADFKGMEIDRLDEEEHLWECIR